MKIESITIRDKKYPQRLKQIIDPPQKLYIIGNADILNCDMIAMVGARECSLYGKEVAQKLAYELAKRKIVVVSGMAKGIDAYSHIGAIQAGMPTIAVLGCGVDVIYPKENAKLYEKILQQGGAIISEYKMGTAPSKMNFPARNRIISGICMRCCSYRSKNEKRNSDNSRLCVRTRKRNFCSARKYK